MLPKCSPSCRIVSSAACLAGLSLMSLFTAGCASTCHMNSACETCSVNEQSSGPVCESCPPTPRSSQKDCEITPCALSQMGNVPRELRKTTLPEYIIEPPDVLLIEAVNNIRPEYAPIHAGEALLVQVNRTIPYGQQEDPVAQQFKQINGIFVIGADGYLNLGPEYGKVLVAEQPLPEIQSRVENHLRQILTNPQVLVTLPRPENSQYVAGPHLVRPDGTVGLGIYGSVYVTGMSLNEAKLAVERHLAQHIHNPQVSVDVLAYNSKVYYIIADGGGAGESVVSMPCTGNETVLDAIARVQGLPTVASKSHIWIARPSADPCGPDQILEVDWNAIAQGAQTGTNYQVLPGDRIYVKASQFITFDTKLAKFTAPFERMFGFTLLGNGTVRTIQRGENIDGGF